MLEKTFQPEKVEAQHYELWEQSGVFKCNPESNTAPFTIMMPPPNVTGSLHLGHALNGTLQDILTRYYRMKGRDALWQPGTDHAGIATQMIVERNLAAEGLNRREMGREKFLEKVWEWKEYSGSTITRQFRRLGTSPDWARERFTMDEGLNRAVRRVFVQLFKEGLIYKDNRLVNWDPKLQTAVSDLEVEMKETKGHMWHIRYPIEGETERFITIATTRPETMLGDTAIIVNPNDDRYKDLVGKFAILPIVGRPIKIIADEYVDPEFGTGAMKVTPAHDFNDFEIGKRHGLEFINIFDRTAHLNENAPEEYQGMERFEARKKLLEELEAQDLLVKIEDVTHAIPYDEKSKSVILEPFMTEQWYCDAKTLAQPAIEAVRSGKTVIIPKSAESTYFHWMENIQPWCISRQLWWGHQIPAWYGPEGSVFVAETEEEAYAEAKAKFGDGVTLTRDEDVLDTWFSSALWPFSTLGWPDKTPELNKYYPGDVLTTAADIIFFWVARMMMMGIHFMGDVPFKTVYLHGLILDGKGQKMSKTRGNVIDPLDTIEKYGADALRFTLAALATQGRNIKLSEDRVETYRNFATKLWNAARYCQMNHCAAGRNYNPATVTATPNKWIISALKETTEAVDAAIEAYKFNDAANALYQFVWGTFCDWYLEFTKPILSGDDKVQAEETRETTGWVLDQILLILNPIMPFITEELYTALAERPLNTALISSQWPEYPASFTHADATTEMNWLIKFITEIRSVRADMNVPAGAKIRLLVKDANAGTQASLKSYDDVLKRMARLETVDLFSGQSVPAGSIQTVVNEATLIMPIADIIDLDKERARLRKEIEKLSSDIEKIEQKLSDKKFVDNAPAEIIEEQHKRKETAETTRTKLSAALKQLEAA
ncbi:valine--tRNA ligase [Micavibrio aeruginosavorus]|uniref:Valine--tRNA ligase n=1 Tax=Micavibrio aeruginosavorus (strain ARL-13) TaxID=856793 RepID=G2KPI2_MICAA|nr:valine--tRNA ligase [Micavibrio aeruginosavorus]AEP09482.1 valyl-tRNA synthetase [Micavibrio aeruginosavorus ARL-13]